MEITEVFVITGMSALEKLVELLWNGGEFYSIIWN